jgi:DNA-directed RNA polymerase specialized sigma24 family protein
LATRILSALSAAERAVVVLDVYCGMTDDEIAAAMREVVVI